MNFQKFILFLIFQKIPASDCPNQRFCASCNQNQCSKCYYSVYDPILKKCVIPKWEIPNCSEYKSMKNPRCSICELGYGLNDQGLCKICKIEECANCDFDVESCKFCLNGFVSNGKNCDENDDLQCLTDNCEICGKARDVCLRCKKTFSLNENLECVNGGIKFCSIMNKRVSYCKLCNSGYYLRSNGSCIPNNERVYSIFHNIIFWTIVLIIIILIIYIYYIFIRRQIYNKEQNLNMNDYYLSINQNDSLI